METTRGDRARQTRAAEPVYMENTLLRVFGVLFSHDAKRARMRTGKVELNKGAKDRNIVVRFDPEYAQPGPFAHKVALAIIRKQSLYGRPIRREISFSQRELMRLAGRNSWSGRYSEQLALALKQVRYTHVIAHFKKGERHVERDFSIFNEVMIERRAHPADPIIACTVVLADPIVESLDDAHFTCLNHVLMEQLGTIGQALYMRLFFHFSTHYDGHHRERVMFRKRYDDTCREWLGGLKIHSHRSKVLDEQLGRHLDELVAIGFLASYDLTPAASGEGFVLTFKAGLAFFEDYARFYQRGTRTQVRAKFDEDRETVGEPHQVAYLFAQKRAGTSRDHVPFVASNEVSTARELLRHLTLSEMPTFFDYALAQAAKTNFRIQTLGGVKQYVTDYLQARDDRAAEKARAQATRDRLAKDEANRAAYGRYVRTAAAKIFDNLPAGERLKIERLAQAKAALFKGGSRAAAQSHFEYARDRITEQSHPQKILSYERWCAKS